jgi:hypothetical protein
LWTEQPDMVAENLLQVVLNIVEESKS